MYSRLARIVFLLLALPCLVCAREFTTISVEAGFSVPVQLPEPATTIAVGNQELISTSTLKPDLILVNGQATGATSLTVFGRSGKFYEYRVQVGNDIAQLRTMIRSLEKNVSVEDLNGTIVLKGTVPSPTSLIRVLSLADRFVTGTNGPPDFSVISDRGGVLSGNLQEDQTGIQEEITGVSPNPNISVPTAPAGGIGFGGGNNPNAIRNALRQPLMPIKGNLAQNISRGDVIMVGGGKVMSLIKVAKQPKVEIQMQIIAVDRNKTDEFGIDWRLDATSGNKQITVGSQVGNVANAAVSAPGGAATAAGRNPGTSDLFAIFQNPGSYTLGTFLRFLEQRGAAKTLSSPLVTSISGESASFLVGGNVPIPVQTVFGGSAVANAAVATNARFIQFGLKLIVRPTVLENGKISIVLDQSISEPDYTQAITLLGSQVPGFNQRSVSTVTESASGESWAVAGLLSEENSKNLSQVPWISKVPVLGALFRNKTETRSRNELMILVNARVIEGDNKTKTSFEGEGDLAPSNNSISSEEENMPLPEEGSQLDKPVNLNEEPKKSRLNPAGNNTEGRSLDLPEVIVPPVNRGPKKPKIKEQPQAETGESYISQDTVAIYSPVIKGLLTKPLRPASQDHAAVTIRSKLIGSEGKLISYEEFPNPVIAKNEYKQERTETKYDIEAITSDDNQDPSTTLSRFSTIYAENHSYPWIAGNGSMCSGLSSQPLMMTSSLGESWLAGLLFTPTDSKMISDSESNGSDLIFASGNEALSAKK